MKTITIIDLHTDGACSGNPGPGRAHWVWKNGTETKGEKPLGDCTNNYAELAAVGCGLVDVHNSLVKAGKDPAAYKIGLRCDSQTVLAWLNGSTPSKEVADREHIMKMCSRIKEVIIPAFAGVRLIQISGERNLADPGNKK